MQDINNPRNPTACFSTDALIRLSCVLPDEVLATSTTSMGFMRVRVLSTQRTSGDNKAHRALP